MGKNSGASPKLVSCDDSGHILLWGMYYYQHLFIHSPVIGMYRSEKLARVFEVSDSGTIIKVKTFCF